MARNGKRRPRCTTNRTAAATPCQDKIIQAINGNDVVSEGESKSFDSPRVRNDMAIIRQNLTRRCRAGPPLRAFCSARCASSLAKPRTTVGRALRCPNIGNVCAAAARRSPRAMARLPYGFSATTLPFFQKYTGVPCMRATLRAVFAARRIPRPTPAAKLSGFLGVLRFVVMVRVPAVVVSLLNCRRLSNDLPRAGRLQESWSSHACSGEGHRCARHYDRLA